MAPSPFEPTLAWFLKSASGLGWNRQSDGFHALVEGGPHEEDTVIIMLTKQGREVTLRAMQHDADVLRVEQRNGLLGGLCQLGELLQSIERVPAPVKARAGTELWLPAGARLATLSEPLSEPQWELHLLGGTIVEMTTEGLYLVQLVDARTADQRTGQVGAGMRYTHRLFLTPSGGGPPVLAVNHELSMMGTAAMGVHRGSRHVNHGPASAQLTLADFRTRARAILAIELVESRSEA